MLTVGPYTIRMIETGRFALDGGAMFGVVPRPLWERAYSAPDAKNRIPMSAKVLVVTGNDRTILVDTGNSPYMPTKQQDIYGLDFSQFSIDSELRSIGIEPQNVTDVLLTHLHFDHAGGAVINDADGTPTPRFANARYYVQKEQYQWAIDPTEKDRASFEVGMFDPLREHGVLDLLDGAGEILPMISVQPLFGHTQAMQAVKISDGETTVFFGADLMPTSGHIGVPFVMGYDNFPLTTISEKKSILPVAADEQWVIAFGHDAFRDAARIGFGHKGPEIREDIRLCA